VYLHESSHDSLDRQLSVRTGNVLWIEAAVI
jgi:hypothetical protein